MKMLNILVIYEHLLPAVLLLHDRHNPAVVCLRVFAQLLRIAMLNVQR